MIFIGAFGNKSDFGRGNTNLRVERECRGVFAMLLGRQLEVQGDFLFRWRGLLPYLLLPLAALAMAQSGTGLEQSMGEYAVEAVDALALTTALLGLTVRVVTVGFVPKGTSGRNTIHQRADTLNTTGLYSCVRNPLYLGNFLVVLGLAMSLQVWWFTLLTCFCFMLYYERIVLKEEAFLQSKFGEEYMNWASTTPAFLPNPRLWRAPELRFSPRSVLRREYNGFYVVAVAFALIELGEDWVEGELTGPESDLSSTLAFLAIATIIYVVLKVLKRRTTLLNVEGR
jgi:protein-S-isoprenylcysteine O-methyltransferase Ste14